MGKLTHLWLSATLFPNILTLLQRAGYNETTVMGMEALCEVAKGTGWRLYIKWPWCIMWPW